MWMPSLTRTFDGCLWARSGKPGLARGMTVWLSFFGGIFASIVLTLVAPQLARIGLEFQPVDYFFLMIFLIYQKHRGKAVWTDFNIPGTI